MYLRLDLHTIIPSHTLSSTQQTRNDLPKGGSRGGINIWICTQSSYPDFKLCAACDVCVHKDFKERDVEKTALRVAAVSRFGFGARNWHARGELD